VSKEDHCKTCNCSLHEVGKYIAVPIETFQEWTEPTGVFDPGPLIARMDFYCLECWGAVERASETLDKQ
jgi:hypothetical protein